MDRYWGRRAGAVLVAAAVGIGGAAAFAAATPAAKVIEARQKNYKQMGGAFKAILDETKKDTPDKALIVANAAKVKGFAQQIPSWFPKGSGPEAHVKTDAKPEIWQDPKGFEAAASRLQVETSKLDQVARGGDMDAIKAQVKATGGACKNCHDKFRVPEKK